MTKFKAILTTILTLAVISESGLPAQESNSKTEKKKFKTIENIEYANINGTSLQLDLRIPENVKNPPLVICIHGGAWSQGSRKGMSGIASWLADNGYASVTISYRLVPKAIFPAQIYDCKGAVRWLKAHAAEYGYDKNKIAVYGESAGGHLAVLLGTSAGEKELEGDVGGNPSESSQIQAIIDFYGPVDFILRSKDQPALTDNEKGRVWQLLGKSVKSDEAFARLASGVYHVTKTSPPLLAVHGTADKTVLPNQTDRLVSVYKENGADVQFHAVEGGEHGGPLFKSPEVKMLILNFLDKKLKNSEK